MRELKVSSPFIHTNLQGADDPVVLQRGLAKIKLRIIWPGYEHIEWVRTIEVYSSQGPITRLQLGAVIASNFARYIEKTQYEATKSGKWRVGPAGIEFENLILLSLYNVFDDSWQASVAIDTRDRNLHWML